MELSSEARDWLATNGYEPDFGARPMRRLIEREIKRPLVDKLLFGDLKDGGTVKVTVEPGATADDEDTSLALETRPAENSDASPSSKGDGPADPVN